MNIKHLLILNAYRRVYQHTSTTIFATVVYPLRHKLKLINKLYSARETYMIGPLSYFFLLSASGMWLSYRMFNCFTSIPQATVQLAVHVFKQYVLCVCGLLHVMYPYICLDTCFTCFQNHICRKCD